MPDELLIRVAEADPGTLSDAFLHIANGADWLMAHVFGHGNGWSPPEAVGGRATLAERLAACRDRLLGFDTSQCFRLADRAHPEHFELESEDMHTVLRL